MSGTIGAEMSRHVALYMSREKKGVGSDISEAKHRQLIEEAVVMDCKNRETNLCTAWIDYKKDYDSMPHTDAGVFLYMDNIKLYAKSE